MAFPQVASINGGGTTTDSTTYAVTLPSGVQSGNLLLLFLSVDSSTTFTKPSGWTELRYGTAGALRFYVAYKIAGGSETNFNITLDNSEAAAHTIMRITGHDPATAPVSGGERSGGGSTSSYGPDPLTSGFGDVDTLWIAYMGHDPGTSAVSGYLSGYSNGRQDRGNSAGGVSVQTCRREYTGPSQGAQNSGFSFTSASLYWTGYVAVAPAPFTAHTKTLTETPTATATFSRAWTLGRALSETATAAASVVKTAARTLLEAITATDSFTKAKLNSEGPNSPSTIVSVSRGVGYAPWSNPGNAASSNDSYATCTHGGGDDGSQFLKATGFNFAIPSGATINGIHVEVEKHTILSGANNQASDDRALIVKGGVNGSTNKGIAGGWPTTDTYVGYGGATDLWGESWTPSDINSADFGFAFASTQWQSSTNNSFVDHIRITVHYELSGNLYTHTYEEVATSADNVLRTGGKFLSDAATATDALLRSVGRTLAETITAAPAFIQAAARNLFETAVASDGLSRAPAKVLSDAATPTATIQKSSGRTLGDAVSATALVLKTAGRVFVDVATMTDLLIRVATFGRSLTESATATPVIVRAPIRFLNESATATDNVIRIAARMLNDTANATASVLKTALRTLTETVTESDAVQYSTEKTAILTETAQAVAAIARTILRTIADILSASDALARTPGKTLIEDQSAGDTLSKGPVKTVSNPIIATDTIIRTAQRTLTEVASAVAVYVASVLRTLSETVSANAALIKSASRVLNEAATATAALIRLIQRALTETVTASATMLRSTGKMFTEPITATATISRNAARSLFDGISASDVLSKTPMRLFEEAASAIDTFFYRFIATPARKGLVILRTAADRAATILTTKRSTTVLKSKDDHKTIL